MSYFDEDEDGGKDRYWSWSPLDEDRLQARAMFLAMCVRNATEDLHASGAVTDATMAQLNPLIRNAIFTGLVAINDFPFSHESVAFVEASRLLIPDYWEPPTLLPGSSLDGFTSTTDIDVADIECPQCGAAPQQQCCRGGNPRYPMASPHSRRFARARGIAYAFIESHEPL